MKTLMTSMVLLGAMVSSSFAATYTLEDYDTTKLRVAIHKTCKEEIGDQIHKHSSVHYIISIFNLWAAFEPKELADNETNKCKKWFNKHINRVNSTQSYTVKINKARLLTRNKFTASWYDVRREYSKL